MQTSKQEIEQSDTERSVDGSESSKTEKKKKDWKDIEYQTTLRQVQKA